VKSEFHRTLWSLPERWVTPAATCSNQMGIAASAYATSKHDVFHLEGPSNAQNPLLGLVCTTGVQSYWGRLLSTK